MRAMGKNELRSAQEAVLPGDRPFKHIDDVISREELVALSDSYKRVAGYQQEQLRKT